MPVIAIPLTENELFDAVHHPLLPSEWLDGVVQLRLRYGREQARVDDLEFQVWEFFQALHREGAVDWVRGVLELATQRGQEEVSETGLGRLLARGTDVFHYQPGIGALRKQLMASV